MTSFVKGIASEAIIHTVPFGTGILGCGHQFPQMNLWANSKPSLSGREKHNNIKRSIAERWSDNSPYFQIWENEIPPQKNVFPKGKLKNGFRWSMCLLISKGLLHSPARRIVTIDILWRVRSLIRFCLLSCFVRSKGEAFPSRSFKLKKFNVVQPKHRLFLYLLGKCFAPTSVGRITRERSQ